VLDVILKEDRSRRETVSVEVVTHDIDVIANHMVQVAVDV
jgi:ABC-type dipeptide/oligopeptide/nickel transport system ATPase component